MDDLTPLPTIRAVCFDAVGTLIHPDPEVGEVYARAGRRHGIEVPSDEIRRRFRRAFLGQDEEDAAAANRTSEERERRRWEAIVAEVFHHQPDPRAPFAELWDHFGRPDAWTCYPDVSAALEALSALGLRLVIASNFDRRLRRVVTGLPALHHCRDLVISSEIGWRKPAPGFFLALSKHTGCSASELLLVGDSVTNDYDGGKAAGLNVVLLARDRPSEPPNRISRLDELPTLVRTFVE